MDPESSQSDTGDFTQVVDDRGHITLFDGLTATVRIRKNGTAKKIWRPPTWSMVKKIDFIEGQTLSRVAVTRKENKGSTLHVAVKKVSDIQRTMQCDGCAKQHSKNNPSCSANLGIKTFASKANHLYSFATREDLGEWRGDISYIGAATVGSGTYQKR